MLGKRSGGGLSPGVSENEIVFLNDIEGVEAIVCGLAKG